MTSSGKFWIALSLTLCLAVATFGRPILPPPQPGGRPTGTENGPSLSPAPSTIDRVVHNQGNIGTTIDNWGYVGGYSFYGLPSGEYPRNSGHDYLAEIRYWMGAISATGDTLVANTYDDFQALPSLITGVAENLILLSTDTTRYYNYDLSDTVGAGNGNAAVGWKVWNADSAAWVYAVNYNPILDVNFAGGPVSIQESHYRFTDNALGSSLMGLEMTHTVLQWNYCYNEDFMFVVLEITNTSVEDYTDFAFGLYVDLDIGGPDGTGENGRLGDLVGSDSTENLAWIYDESGRDAGWGAATGIMGTKYLETPGDVGMTAFRTGDWSALPDEDPGKFALINSAQYDGSLPPTDQYYVQCTRGIDLPAGQTVRVVYALIAGMSEAEFRDNAQLAQNLYDNNFVGPAPPNTPTLTGVASDGKVYLSWDDTAQVTIDPLSGENDFSGYKLYRSDNQGYTWGEDIDTAITSDCQDEEYEVEAYYKVNDPTDLIPRSIIDYELVNGVEYWYCLVAFDTGASATGVDVLQTGFGVPGSATNIISITPRTDPAGFFEAAGTVTHNYTGSESPSEGSIAPTVFDRSQLLGANYKVVIEDRPDQTVWHLINVTTGDTVLADQTQVNGEAGMFEIIDGLRVMVRDADPVPSFRSQTAVGGASATLDAIDQWWYGPATEVFTGNLTNHRHYRETYELRFSTDSTIASAINDNVGMGMAWSVPFEVWNMITGERVALMVYDFGLDGTWDPWDLLLIVNVPYDPVEDPYDTGWPNNTSWMFGWDDVIYNPAVGDVYTIEGAHMNSPDDVFLFAADGILDAKAKDELKNIKVVPDPYYAYSSGWEISQGENEIRFQNLPEQCTIRIYTLSGDLLQTLEHNNSTGDEVWNLQSASRRLVVSGIYIYHVETKYGDRLGRFAIVK